MVSVSAVVVKVGMVDGAISTVNNAELPSYTFWVLHRFALVTPEVDPAACMHPNITHIPAVPQSARAYLIRNG